MTEQRYWVGPQPRVPAAVLRQLQELRERLEDLASASGVRCTVATDAKRAAEPYELRWLLVAVEELERWALGEIPAANLNNTRRM